MSLVLDSRVAGWRGAVNLVFKNGEEVATEGKDRGKIRGEAGEVTREVVNVLNK